MVFFFLTLIKINKISIAPAFHVTPFPTEIQLLCSTHLMLTVANVLQIWKLSELKTHILCVSLTSVILWRQTRKSKTTFATILLPSSHRGRSSLLQHSILPAVLHVVAFSDAMCHHRAQKVGISTFAHSARWLGHALGHCNFFLKLPQSLFAYRSVLVYLKHHNPRAMLCHCSRPWWAAETAAPARQALDQGTLWASGEPKAASLISLSAMAPYSQ